MVDNYIQTQNPIFPFLNNIFKSEYYNFVNGNDINFGIPNLWYAFIWPIEVTIYPLKGYDFYVVDPLWGMGYIVCLINIMYRYKKKDIIWKLSMIGIICSIVWAVFLNGYTRYALVIPILFYIVIISSIITIGEKIQNYTFKIIDIIIFYIILFFLICSIFVGIEIIVSRIYEAYMNRIDINNYYVDEEIYEIDGVWGSIDCNNAIIELIRNPETPIYNLDVICKDYDFSEKSKNEILNKLADKNIYTVIQNSEIDDELEKLNEEGFKIIDEPIIYKNSKFQNIDEYWYILKLEYVQ
jgi:hypothetical protein